MLKVTCREDLPPAPRLDRHKYYVKYLERTHRTMVRNAEYTARLFWRQKQQELPSGKGTKPSSEPASPTSPAPAPRPTRAARSPRPAEPTATDSRVHSHRHTHERKADSPHRAHKHRAAHARSAAPK